ncbi:hypothetical protein [Vibrio campbellii]|uniref:hypothetical protein n=1 Tax=Vibrio campbellii TaxID=680 RepID=UPI003857E020
MGYSDFKRKKTNSPTAINLHRDTVMQSQAQEVFEYLTNPRTIYCSAKSGIYLYDNLPDAIDDALSSMSIEAGEPLAISRRLPRSEFWLSLASVTKLTKRVWTPRTVEDCMLIRNLSQHQTDALKRLGRL